MYVDCHVIVTERLNRMFNIGAHLLSSILMIEEIIMVDDGLNDGCGLIPITLSLKLFGRGGRGTIQQSTVIVH